MLYRVENNVENGNVDYNISLNKNEFFETATLPSSNQYIATLIDNIDISYKYNLQMKDNKSQQILPI